MRPDDRKYRSSHEWVRVEGDIAVIGITEHAQDSLGDVVFVELPEPGASFGANSWELPPNHVAATSVDTSAESRATNASSRPAFWVANPVAGMVRSVESANPATTISPSRRNATSVTSSTPEPPRKLLAAMAPSPKSSLVMNPSRSVAMAPPKVTSYAPVVTGKSEENVVPTTTTCCAAESIASA